MDAHGARRGNAPDLTSDWKITAWPEAPGLLGFGGAAGCFSVNTPLVTIPAWR